MEKTKLELKSNYYELLGLHSYCLEDCLYDKSKSYCENEKIVEIKIIVGRKGEKVSLGISEEYLSGKHYDILVGFGFGLIGFDFDKNLKHNNHIIKIPKIKVKDIIDVIFNRDTLKIEFFLNGLLLYQCILFEINEKIYFCMSSGGYSGISTLEVESKIR